MFLPRFHEISKKYPKSKIILLTKSRTKAKQLLKYDKSIHGIEFIDNLKTGKKKSIIFLFKLFRKYRFKLVFSYQYGPKYLKYIFVSKLYNSKTYYYGIFKKKEPLMLRAIKANEDWLKISIKERVNRISVKDQDKQKKRQIVIGLGASGDNKRWPTSNFIKLIHILKRNNFEFILAGGEKETEIINTIKYKNLDIDLISLEKFNLELSIQIIKNSMYHIGNDSGFMHICAGLGMKSFCLYGDTPSVDALYNEKIIPILPRGYSKVDHDSNVMDKINVDWVLQVFRKYS